MFYFNKKEGKLKAKKIAGIVILIVGIIGLILSLTADLIKVGMIGSFAGFGIVQIVGTALGVIFAVVGVILMTRK